MKIKADWSTYLHALRRREIEIVFAGCPPKVFPRGLELGAGDGYQSGLLLQYVGSLVVTDFAPEIAERPDAPGMTHRVCDAERVDETFGEGEFDLIFSSNMMEHLPEPEKALAGMHRVLADGGVAIHLMPSVFWKLSQMAGFHLNLAVSRLERYASRRAAGSGAPAGPERAWDNNPKVARRRRSYLRRLFWPVPHGASRSNVAEFLRFRKAYWRERFARAGFDVAAVLRGPVSSGYGFGFDRLRAALERLGVASEYAYVTAKAGRASPYLACFRR